MQFSGLRLRVLIVFAAWSLACVQAVAEEWGQFRGGGASGVAADSQLATSWAPEEHVAWKVKLAGTGWSQPVAAGGKVFVTIADGEQQAKPNVANRGPGVSGFAAFFSSSESFKPPEANYQWKVLCLDAKSGDVEWEKVAREGRPTIHIHPNNTYATETPVTDGERVIAYFGMAGVYCYGMDGEPLWTKDLGAFPMQLGWGAGSSPALWEDKVFIQCDNDKDKGSFLVALDKKTGDEVWRVPREERSNWSTPYVWKNKVRTELVTAGGGKMRSYDPATGKLLWEMEGSGRTACTPVGDEELAYVDSYDRLTGGNGRLAAVRAGASGDITLAANETSSEHVAWSIQLRGYRIASPLLYQGCLYVLENQSGIIRCLDAKTGAEHDRKRLPKATGFTASPIASGGKVYCLDQEGAMVVIDAGPEMKVVSTNALDEMCWASPGVAGDRLLVRTIDHLYAIGDK